MLAIALPATLPIAFMATPALAAGAVPAAQGHLRAALQPELAQGPFDKASSAPTTPAQGRLPWLQKTKVSRPRSASPLASTPSVGGSWSWQNPLPDGNPLYAISCPIASTCFGAGYDSPILSTTDGGSTWNQQAQAFGITGISCATVSTCVGVDYFGFVISTVDGHTWTGQSINGGHFLSGVSCASATVCFVVGYAGSIFRTGDGGSSWTAQTSGTSANLFGISCPTTTTCYAVGDGPNFLKTADGGSSWSDFHPNLATSISLYAISCATVSACMAVGQTGSRFETSNGGLDNWPSDGGMTTANNFLGVSCPTATQCFLASGDGFVYRQVAPSLWSHASVGEPGSLYAISCPTGSACYTDGDFGTIAATTSGGTGWSQQLGLPANNLNGISCPSAAVCFAAGAGGEIGATTNGGTTWSTQNSGTPWALSSISCPSISTCHAVGVSGTVIGTTDGGTTWNLQTLSTGNLVSISCVPTACYAVTNVSSFIKTTDGINWSSPAGVGVATGLTGISCATASVCFATDADSSGQNLVYVTTDGGVTWTISFNLASDSQAGISAPFGAITCPSATTCFAVGGSGLIATTTDGGANWRTDNSSSNVTLTGVSCPDTNTCYATASDSTILHTTDNGGIWDVQMGTNPYAAISCPSPAVCFAVGSGGVNPGAVSATANGGAAWTRQQPAGTTRSIHGISCPNVLTCFAVAFDTILTTHDGGVTWTTRTLTTTDQLTGISCPDVNTCYAVGWPGAIYFTGNGGTSWSYQANSISGEDQSLNDVSCWSTTSCVAVGTGGTALSTSNGGTWTVESSGTIQFLLGVSCPSSALCVATGTNGAVITRSSGSWQSRVSGTSQYLDQVACPTASVCYAAGQAGTMLRSPDGGISWAADTSGTTENLLGLACVNAADCVAAGTLGIVIGTSDGSRWVDHSPPTLNNLYSVATPDQNHVWIGGAGGSILESTLPPVAAILPAASNAAYGGYTTAAEITNIGTSPASITIGYVDSNGDTVGSGDSIASLPPNATWTVRQDNGNGFLAGGAGSAVIYSSQPVASFVNEFAPGVGDATSYTGINPGVGAGTTLFAPTITNNAYGGYTTGIGLVNASAAPTNITITYRNAAGTAVKTQTLTGVAAGAYQGLYSGDVALGLPSGFAGTATITSSAGPLAAIVNETGPGGQLSSYDTVTAGSSTLFAPAALRNAYGGYNTGMGIQNTTGTAGTVTINYYNASGAATTTTAPIAANGYLGVYQGTDIAADGPYTAKITSTVAIAAIVNEVAPSTSSAQQSTAYNTFASGSATLHLPLVESAGSDAWSTGEGIMNTGSTATTVTVTYYDTSSGAAIGTPQSQSLQPNAYWGLYQPLGGLASGDRASAVVTTSTGGQVAVVCNESSSTSFMSYTGQ